MTTTQTPQIYADINTHMKKYNLPPGSWYVGIAADAPDRLFVDHKVSQQNGIWIWRRAVNHREARDIEIAYHEYGCKGSHGGGDFNTNCVYAYVITQSTLE